MSKKVNKKKKNLHLRFFFVLADFLIETAIFIALVFFFINYETYRIYYWIPIILITLFDIILGLFIANTKVEIDFKLSWLAIVIVLPFLGGMLYLMFAHKITTKKRKKIRNNPLKQFLRSNKYDASKEHQELLKEDSDSYKIAKYLDYCGYPIYQNTNFSYYESGEKGFPVILEELEKAKKFIFIEYFIIEFGEFYNSIYEILKKKAKEGVKVIFLYDDFGTSMKLNSFYYKEVRKDGIECYPFNRISPTINIRQNSRDHKKIIIIDGVVGFTGGCNLADEYINKIKRFGYWKDNIVRIKGKAVDSLTLPFLGSYYFASKKTLSFDEFSYENNKNYLDIDVSKFNSFIAPFSDIPFDTEAITKNVYLSLINSAKRYIYLSTPYLVPDDELVNALNNAAKRGADVKIITPGIPDKKLIYQVTRSYYSEFIIKGIKIYEFTPGFNHEKMMVVDDKMAYTGTCNFDYRSMYLNMEDGLFISLDDEILKMKDSMLKMIKKSKLQDIEKYIHAPLIKRWYRSLLRVVAPLM